MCVILTQCFRKNEKYVGKSRSFWHAIALVEIVDAYAPILPAFFFEQPEVVTPYGKF